MKWLYWLVGIVVAIIVAWNMMFPTYTFRFRATVTVSTPQGPKTGSSVIEVTWTKLNPLDRALSGGHDWRYKVRGTAPIIDLGQRGTLIAALRYEAPSPRSKTGQPEDLLERPSDADLWPMSAFEKHIYELNSRLPAAELKRGLPQFVWVPPEAEDLSDAVPLLPKEFKVGIGNQYRLTSVVLKPSTDAVVSEIANQLDWWRRLRSETTRRANLPDARGLRSDFFLRIRQIQTGATSE